MTVAEFGAYILAAITTGSTMLAWVAVAYTRGWP